MDDREYFDQVADIAIDNGSAAGVYQENVTLDIGFDRIESVRVVPISAQNDYQIGLDLQADARIIKPTLLLDWQFAAATPMSERGKRITGTAKGNNAVINTRITAELAAELSYQMIFRLSRPRKER